MSWAACAIYLIGFVLLIATGNRWCLGLAGLALFAFAVGAAVLAARQEAMKDASDDIAEDFGGSFRGHLPGASDE